MTIVYNCMVSVPSMDQNHGHLVGALEHECYFSIYWEQSSQLTKSYFSEG